MTDEYEYLSQLRETLGEIETQYKSECALYGDAWPGALIQLQDLKKEVKDLEAKLNVGPPADWEDIDF